MSAIYDYGQRQKDEGIKEGIKKMAEYMIKEGKSNEETNAVHLKRSLYE